MKKWFTLFTLFNLFCLSAQAAPQAQDSLSGTKTTAIGYVENNTTASVTLIPAITGQTITLYKYTLSTGAADNFYLRCGTTQKTAKLYMAANTTLDSTLLPLYLKCASGEALNLNKGTAATAVGVSLWFNQEP